ncbi:hypothetical protein LOK49_Contig138G00004 [Camellia lanceoleosa]|nr:hypothetical protein LOK49_Contig138G00004 [Camellia lanceoleosa]
MSKTCSTPDIPNTYSMKNMHKISITVPPLEEMIFGVVYVTGCGFTQFVPYEEIEGNPVPTVIFKDKPSFYHAFLLTLTFAFTASVVTILLRHRYPKIATRCRVLAFASTAIALGIVLWLVLPTSFGLMASILCHQITFFPMWMYVQSQIAAQKCITREMVLASFSLLEEMMVALRSP